MNQLSLFDQEKSKQRKQDGQEAAAESRKSDLDIARDIARELCLKNGTTNADEVGKLLFERHGIKSLGPAAGSLFKSGFVATGEMVKSERKKNHSRLLYVWRLK